MTFLAQFYFVHSLCSIMPSYQNVFINSNVNEYLYYLDFFGSMINFAVESYIYDSHSHIHTYISIHHVKLQPVKQISYVHIHFYYRMYNHVAECL